jgi:hypothetical protein
MLVSFRVSAKTISFGFAGWPNQDALQTGNRMCANGAISRTYEWVIFCLCNGMFPGCLNATMTMPDASPYFDILDSNTRATHESLSRLATDEPISDREFPDASQKS